MSYTISILYAQSRPCSRGGRSGVWGLLTGTRCPARPTAVYAESDWGAVTWKPFASLCNKETIGNQLRTGNSMNPNSNER